MRRTVRGLLACAAVTLAVGDLRADDPVVGAIRWDAWQDPTDIGVWTDKTLSPPEWHYRLPFFGNVISDTQVHIDGNNQATMDQEIAYAAKAGIKYWAFVSYPDAIGMSNGLHLYLSSPKKSQINYCLDLQGGWLSQDPATWAQQVSRYVGYFKDPSYQKVAGGRPLVYLLGTPEGTTRFPTAADARNAFDQLRQAAVAAGAGNPYIVYQGGDIPSDHACQAQLGLDAISTYALPATAPNQPYSTLTPQAQSFWNSAKATGSQVVPLASAGWDNRPRFQNPTPWDAGGQNYFQIQTQRELSDHITQSINWVKANAAASNANAVLTYAWNEHDEGGWLCPTLKANGTIDTSRVDAVGKAIAMVNHPSAIANGSFEATAATPWYRVPSGGLPSNFGWHSDAYDSAYLVAAPGAGHFSAADDGSQALLMSNARRIWQDVGTTQPGSVYYLSFSLSSDQYQGQTPGTVTAQLLVGGNVMGSQLFDTASDTGWGQHIMAVTLPDQAQGALTVQFVNQSGMAWIDNVQLGSIIVPEPTTALLTGAGMFGLLLRRTR